MPRKSVRENGSLVAWARSSLSVMFGDVPLAGREPPLIARQPIE
jgi:hypothetical protein